MAFVFIFYYNFLFIVDNILILSQNDKLLKLLSYRLSFFGFASLFAKDTKAFFDLLYKKKIAFIILDASSSFDLFYLCKVIRIHSNFPLLIISNDINCIEFSFFQINEFLLKPFSIKELDNKIFSLLKIRSTIFSLYKPSNLRVLNLFEDKRIVSFSQNEVDLTKIEFSILSLLLNMESQLCHKSLILEKIWGYNDPWSFKSNVVEVHVSKMKKKIVHFFPQKNFIRKRGNFFLFSFYKF